jgi:hypothetical protein
VLRGEGGGGVCFEAGKGVCTLVPKRNFMPCLARYLPSVTKRHRQLLPTYLAKAAGGLRNAHVAAVEERLGGDAADVEAGAAQAAPLFNARDLKRHAFRLWRGAGAAGGGRGRP